MDNSNVFIVIGIIAGVIVVIGIIIAIWAISTSNLFKKTLESVKEAESGIDVALTKRYDVLTKELAIVKGYAKHETETLLKIIEARQPVSGSSFDDKNASTNAMNEASEKIKILAEQYPELRSNTNYLGLQNQVADCEEHLQAARRVYNSNARIFNQLKVSFPASIFGKKYAKVPYFEAEELKKEDVKIDL